MDWSTRWGSLATGRSADGEWTFKRAGFIHPRITVREPGRDTDLYSVQVTWGGEGILDIPGRGNFRWIPNVWHRRWVLQGPDGKEVMHMTLNGFTKISGAITINPKWLNDRMLSLVTLLGWYLMMLVVSDEAAATYSFVPVLS
jgi:hypothetical protein